MTLSISHSSSLDKDSWEAFAQKLGKYHGYSWAWKEIIEKTFSFRTHYLQAKEGSSLVGILPLVELKSFLFGHALISLPYINGGGLLSAEPEVERELIEEAKKLTRQCNANYLELRQRAPLSMPTSDVIERSHKVSMLLSLQPSVEKQWEAFSSKLRSQIKRPAKDGCVLACQTDDVLLEMFYSVFSQNMRDLGTPVLPRRLFCQTLESFGPRAKLFVVVKENIPLAAGFTIAHGEAIEVLWASSLARYNKFSPNMLLYWEMISHAIEKGFKTFDFGRCSRDSGTYNFKKQWGATELPLYWYYFVAKGTIPDVSPSSSKFRILVECWKKLPLCMANQIGGLLSKHLP